MGEGWGKVGGVFAGSQHNDCRGLLINYPIN